MHRSVTFAILAGLLFVTNAARAIPLPKRGFAQVIPATFKADYDFEGIVALSNCSGSLVRFEGSRDSDQAMILTNGHCLESGFANPGEFTYNKKTSRKFTLLNPSGSDLAKVNADLIIYSSMTKTDLTLYRLKETFSDIKTKYGIRALTLSAQHPGTQTMIDVISGYWQRGYTCKIEAFIPHLKEDKWTWDDSIRYSRPGCETIGGTSGSPIIDHDMRLVIGVNNTGNENGEKCSLNNPCEVDENGGLNWVMGYSYGQQTFWLYSCLNKNMEIDLSIEGCMLQH